MDPLSQVIALTKPQAVAWRMIEGHDAWAIAFPQTELVAFGQLIEGRCEIVPADGQPRDFEAGDFLLLAAPRPWTARTSRHATPVDLKAYLAEPALLRSGADAPAVTRFFAGAFAFASPNAALMASLTPPLIHVRATEVAAGPLGALLGLLAGEALGEAPGRALVLDRLLEIILVHALRHRPADLADPPRGLLSGLSDPRLAAALTLMHTHPDRPWTVAQLGREAGMSRSAFAAHFAEVIGAPPIDYLASWRISLAKNALTEADANMAKIAEQIGYASVSAFSTAFTRETGASPTAYARAARARVT
jgi:AraC-like DNA-binding protein